MCVTTFECYYAVSTNAECYHVVTGVECHFAVYHQYNVLLMLSVIKLCVTNARVIILCVTNAECYVVSPILSVIILSVTNAECHYSVYHQC